MISKQIRTSDRRRFSPFLAVPVLASCSTIVCTITRTLESAFFALHAKTCLIYIITDIGNRLHFTPLSHAVSASSLFIFVPDSHSNFPQKSSEIARTILTPFSYFRFKVSIGDFHGDYKSSHSRALIRSRVTRSS